MFEWMNRHKKDIMKYTLWLVIPSFIVMYGYGECQKPRRYEWVARVNGNPIHEYEWSQWMENIRRRMEQYGQEVKRDELQSQALETSITLSLNRAKSETFGLQTLDAEVSKTIHEMPYFKDEAGNFSVKAYQGILAQVGQHPIQFEEEQRDTITRTKLRAMVANSMFPADSDMKQLDQRESQKIQIDYLAFEPSRYVDDVTPTAEGMQKFFDDNREDYRIPDQRRIAYARFYPENFITDATFSEYQLNRFFEDNRQEYKFPDSVMVEYLTYSSKAFIEKAQASDEEIQKHFQENQSSYMNPPQAQIRYIVQPIADLLPQQEVTDQEIKDFYDKNIQRFTHDEEAKARHILLKATPGISAEEDNAIKTRLLDIRKEIEGGLSFEEAAKKYSEDLGSGEKGGDLGFFGRGRMVPPFEKAAFELPLGQISEPVKSNFGYHLIKVEDRREKGTDSLETVREQILDNLRKQKALNAFREEMEKLQSLDSLTGRYEIKTTDWFTSETTLPGLKSNESSMITSAAFRKNPNSPISVVGYPSMDNIFAIERLGSKDSTPQTIDEAREKVTTDVKNKKAEELALAAAQADADRIKSASLTLDAIATERGLQVETSDYFSRDDQFIRGFGMRPTELVSKVFTMSQGEIAGPLKTQMGNHIVRLAALEPEHIPKLEEVRAKVEQDCLQNKAEQAAQLEARKFTDVLYSQQIALEIGAASDKVDSGTTGLFSLQDPLPGIGPQPALNQAVFKIEKTGEISDPVPVRARSRSMNPNEKQNIEAFYVMQLQEIKPTYLPELSEVKEQVEKDYRLLLAEEIAVNHAGNVLEQIQGTLASSQPVTATKAIELKTYEDADSKKTDGKGGVYRGPYEITGNGMVSGISGRPWAFIKTAMALEPGQVSGLVKFYRDKTTKDGDTIQGPLSGVYILQVLGKSAAAEEEDSKKQLRKQMDQRLQSIAYEAWIDEVSAAAEIEYNKKILSPEDEAETEATMKESDQKKEAAS